MQRMLAARVRRTERPTLARRSQPLRSAAIARLQRFTTIATIL
jgi:hypothetical protein